MVCLSCTATGERVCLAAEGFGNRHCFLENIADKVKANANFVNNVSLISSLGTLNLSSLPEHTAGLVAMRVRDRAGPLGEGPAGIGYRCRLRDGNV